MFKNSGKIAVGILVNGLISLPFDFVSAIMIFYFILSIFNQVENNSPEDIGMTIVIGAFFTFIAWVLLRRCITAYRADRLSSYFMRYPEGLVPIAEVASFMNMKVNRFFRVFMECRGRGYLINCSVFADDPTFIILENGEKEIKNKFAIIHCKQCSAPNAIRLGFENKCKYCGTVVDSSEFIKPKQ